MVSRDPVVAPIGRSEASRKRIYKRLGLFRENGKLKGLFLQSIRNLEVNSQIASGHYTNYAVIHGSMPRERDRMFSTIVDALQKEEEMFRPLYVGTK